MASTPVTISGDAGMGGPVSQLRALKQWSPNTRLQQGPNGQNIRSPVLQPIPGNGQGHHGSCSAKYDSADHGAQVALKPNPALSVRVPAAAPVQLTNAAMLTSALPQSSWPMLQCWPVHCSARTIKHPAQDHFARVAPVCWLSPTGYHPFEMDLPPELLRQSWRKHWSSRESTSSTQIMVPQCGICQVFTNLQKMFPIWGQKPRKHYITASCNVSHTCRRERERSGVCSVDCSILGVRQKWVAVQQSKRQLAEFLLSENITIMSDLGNTSLVEMLISSIVCGSWGMCWWPLTPTLPLPQLLWPPCAAPTPTGQNKITRPIIL